MTTAVDQTVVDAAAGTSSRSAVTAAAAAAIVYQFSPFDVLFGKDSALNVHSGNRIFLNLVSWHSSSFVAAAVAASRQRRLQELNGDCRNDTDRSWARQLAQRQQLGVVDSVVSYMKSNYNSRFLVLTDTGWYELGKDDTRRRVRRALRLHASVRHGSNNDGVKNVGGGSSRALKAKIDSDKERQRRRGSGSGAAFAFTGETGVTRNNNNNRREVDNANSCQGDSHNTATRSDRTNAPPSAKASSFGSQIGDSDHKDRDEGDYDDGERDLVGPDKMYSIFQRQQEILSKLRQSTTTPEIAEDG